MPDRESEVTTRSSSGRSHRPRLRLARRRSAALASPCSTGACRPPGRRGSRPACWLRSASSTFGEPELLEMTLASPRSMPDFVAELEAATGVRVGYARQGALHVALDRDEAAELRRVHDLQRSLGLEAEWLPPRRCRELEPGLTPSFNGGVHVAGRGGGRPADAGRGAAGSALAARASRCGPGSRSRRRCSTASGSSGCEPTAARSFAPRRRPRRRRLVGQAEWLPEPARPPVRPVKGQILELRARRRRRARASGSSPPSASTWCPARTGA